jgi:putative endonuclease
MFTVYILRSSKLDRFYTGFTTNLDLRLHFHENAEVRKFTAKADDWVLFLEITCASKTQGLAIEKHIKKMKSRVYIENLIKYPEIIEKLKVRYLGEDC